MPAGILEYLNLLILLGRRRDHGNGSNSQRSLARHPAHDQRCPRNRTQRYKRKWLPSLVRHLREQDFELIVF